MIDRKEERTQRFNRKKRNKKSKPVTVNVRKKESSYSEEYKNYTYLDLKNLGE